MLDAPQLKYGTLDSLMVGKIRLPSPPRCLVFANKIHRPHHNVCFFFVGFTLWQSLSDELGKHDASIEGVIRKIERQYNDLAGSPAEPLTISSGGMSPRAYLQKFSWDIAKYSKRKSLPELVELILSVRSLCLARSSMSAHALSPSSGTPSALPCLFPAGCGQCG